MLDIKNIWLDCDPGHDDMLAIIMAALHPQCNLIGILTSAGNSTIQNTTQNTLNILEEIGRTDIDVYKGCQSPLCWELHVAPEVHGNSGLEGATLKKAQKQPITDDALLKAYQKIMDFPQKIDYVVTGAMTNLSLLMKVFPKIKTKIKQITIMGGAIGRGNWSAASEYNILVDPQAATMVFNSGIKVTHTVEIDDKIFKKLKDLPSQFSNKLYDLFIYFQVKYKENQNFQFPVAHDPCTIFYLLHPECFKGADAYVEIERQGKSKGRTNCYFMRFPKEINSFVCDKMDIEAFWKVMMECIEKIK